MTDQPTLFDFSENDEAPPPEPLLDPADTAINDARRLCMDRSSELDDLVGLIEQIPTFAGRVIERANSPFFAPKAPVRDLHRAVSLLGRDEMLFLLEAAAKR